MKCVGDDRGDVHKIVYIAKGWKVLGEMIV